MPATAWPADRAVAHFVFSDLTHSTDAARDLITGFANGSGKFDLSALGRDGFIFRPQRHAPLIPSNE